MKDWNKTFHLWQSAACILTASLALAHPAGAQTVYNLQIWSYGGGAGEYSGQGNPKYDGANALGAGGDTWNYLEDDNSSSSISQNNLVDSNGNAAGDIGTSISQNFDYSGDVGTYENNAASSSPSSLLSEYAAVNKGVTGTFEISGLSDNTDYNLALYAANGDFNNANTAFTVDNATALTSTTATNGPSTSGQSSFVAGGNYVEFTGETTSLGDILGTYSGPGPYGGEGDFYGFSLELTPTAAPAPEGSTTVDAALALTVGLTGIFFASRRRKSDGAEEQA